MLLVAALSGCGWFKNSEPEYVASVEHEPLKVPEGLDRPESSTPVVIGSPEMRKPVGDELEPAPPRVTNTMGKQEGKAYLSWSIDGVCLLVKDKPQSVAESLRSAIDSNGMKMLEASTSGAHRFQYKQQVVKKQGTFSRLAFWRKKPADYSGNYKFSLKADGENTRVYLLLGTGEIADTSSAEHVLDLFTEYLD